MNLQHRIQLLKDLGKYMLSQDENWIAAKEKANRENGWFTPEFIDLSVKSIAETFLGENILNEWTRQYQVPEQNSTPHKVGIIMAGNIPMVGFHDLLCVFITGNIAVVKQSSKDQVLIKHLSEKLIEWDPQVSTLIKFEGMLKNCDAYIATGSNNSAGYFDYYFGKYPHIIRCNRTSVAILNGNESLEMLEKLADDVYQYFGLGCRNVTKLYVPKDYDFLPLINRFKKYDYLAENHKYKNNYDYNLAIQILNKKYYMSNESILLVEDVSIFSPISQLNYEFYEDPGVLEDSLKKRGDIQCIVGENYTPFGKAQQPAITDYADGEDTMKFLTQLPG